MSFFLEKVPFLATWTFSKNWRERKCPWYLGKGKIDQNISFQRKFWKKVSFVKGKKIREERLFMKCIFSYKELFWLFRVFPVPKNAPFWHSYASEKIQGPESWGFKHWKLGFKHLFKKLYSIVRYSSWPFAHHLKRSFLFIETVEPSLQNVFFFIVNASCFFCC